MPATNARSTERKVAGSGKNRYNKASARRTGKPTGKQRKGSSEVATAGETVATPVQTTIHNGKVTNARWQTWVVRRSMGN